MLFDVLCGVIGGVLSIGFCGVLYGELYNTLSSTLCGVLDGAISDGLCTVIYNEFYDGTTGLRKIKEFGAAKTNCIS